MGSLRLNLKYRQLEDLIREAQRDPSNASPAMDEIIQRFDRLAMKLAADLTADRYMRDDLANSARFALMAAVRRHDGSPGFPAYARIFMSRAAQRDRRRTMSHGHSGADAVVTPTDFTDPLAEPMIPSVDPLDLASVWGAGATALAVTTLSHRQQVVLGYRYVNDLTLGAIGALTNSTGSAVRQRLETSHRAIVRVLAA
jgi:RNA polymerase sigma factor (sigma-70 family)